MSSYKRWAITCDGCGRVFEAMFPSLLETVKHAARIDGWDTGKVRTDFDWCPKCRADQ